MNTPRKNADVIKQWADGAEVEFKCQDGSWMATDHPNWQGNLEYRVKPQPEMYSVTTHVRISALDKRDAITKANEILKVLIKENGIEFSPASDACRTFC